MPVPILVSPTIPPVPLLLRMMPPNVALAPLAPTLRIDVVADRLFWTNALDSLPIDRRPLMVWLVPLRLNTACTEPLTPLRTRF